jgi:glycogen(starch) synthase
MRLAFYSPNYPGITQDGGIGSYTRTLARQLVKLGHVVHVITPGPGATETAEGVVIHQVTLRHLPILDRLWPGYGQCHTLAKKLHQVVTEHRIALVELPNWEGLGIHFQRQSKVPTVVRLHTSSAETQAIDELPSTRLLRADVKREYLQAHQARLLVTHSKAHQATMSQELNIPAQRIILIPHGVEVCPEFVRQPRPDGPPQVVFLGRLEKRKGALELLQAMPHILAKHPGTMLTLIGSDRPHCPPGQDGQPRTHAQWLADELPALVRQHIHFAGRLPQDEVDRHLQNADVFVAPSRYESFGLIYPEAMRWGIPVIGCRVGGVPEIIEDGKTGLLVAPGSSSAIADAVVRLLDSPTLRNQLGTAGRAAVETHFSAEVMARRVVEVYESHCR